MGPLRTSLLATIVLLALEDCWAQPPLRSQTFLVSQSEVNGQASLYFSEVKSAAIAKGTLVESGRAFDRIKGIAERIIKSAQEYRGDSDSWAWDIILVNEPTRNAFCLPGGKIVLYAGLVEGLELDDDELAAVVGHEVAHALREHGREKRSNAAIANVAVGVLTIAAGVLGHKKNIDPAHAMNVARFAGGATASLFFLLPNSRDMELEADAIGVELAARAGFTPSAAQSLWRKMSSGSRLEFLSTHPSPETRTTELDSAVSRVSMAFADRRLNSPPIAAIPAAADHSSERASAMTTMIGCELPNSGSVESMALFACQRLGGTQRETSK